MLPSVTTEKITLTYPLFAADFLDGDHLVVGGGGGPGNSGVGNKITLLDVSKSTAKQSDTETNIKQLAEHEFSRTEDACMSLAVSRPVAGDFKTATIFAGVNSAAPSIAAGENKHFRTFTATRTSLTPGPAHSFFAPAPANKDTYQHLLRTTPTLTAIASAGSTPPELLLLSPTAPHTPRRIPTTAAISDLDLTADTLAFCTRTTLHILTPPTATTPPTTLPLPPLPGSLRALRILSPSLLLLAHNRPARSGADLLLLSLPTGALLARRALPRTIRAVTSLDATPLSPSAALAVVAGADSSLHILAVENTRIKPASTLRAVDPFQITKVCIAPPPAPPHAAESSTATAINPPGERGCVRVAAVAMSNAVVVLTLPLLPVPGGWRLVRARSVLKQTVLSGLGVLVCVVVMAVVMQGILVRRGGLEVGRWGEVVRGVEGVVERVRGREGGEEAVDGLLRGMEAGGVADVWGVGVDREELRGGEGEKGEGREGKGEL